VQLRNKSSFEITAQMRYKHLVSGRIVFGSGSFLEVMHGSSGASATLKPINIIGFYPSHPGHPSHPAQWSSAEDVLAPGTS
jgi:hypothetical protein